jgi:hypothetical protein
VFLAGTPNGAAPGPDKKETIPIFISAGAAEAAGACAWATPIIDPITTVAISFLLKFMLSPIYKYQTIQLLFYLCTDFVHLVVYVFSSLRQQIVI